MSSRINARLAPPTAKLGQCPWPAIKVCANCHRSRRGPWLSMERPNSLGNWLISTVSAMPFM
ncbi:hypothetical protein D3C79_766770 [compost metagenome]